MCVDFTAKESAKSTANPHFVLQNRIEDGVDLMGYTNWGCVDMVSMSTGEFSKRYGFIYMDKHDDGSGTMARSRKKSFYWYKDVIGRNGRTL